MASSQTTLPVFKDLDRPLPWWGHVLLGLPAVLGGIGYGLQGKPTPSEMLAPLQEIVKQQRRRQKLAALKQAGYLEGMDESLLGDFDLPELLQVAQLQRKQPRPVEDYPALTEALIGPEPAAKLPIFPETPLTPEEGLLPMYQPPDPARQAWKRARAGLAGLSLSPEQASERLLSQRFEDVKEGRLERRKRQEALSRAKLELLKSKALTAEQQQAIRSATTEDQLLSAIPLGQERAQGDLDELTSVLSGGQYQRFMAAPTAVQRHVLAEQQQRKVAVAREQAQAAAQVMTGAMAARSEREKELEREMLRYTPTQQKTLTDVNDILLHVEAIQEIPDADLARYVGYFQRPLKDIEQFVRTDPGFQEFRALVGDLEAGALHEKAGAALTPLEMKKYAQAIPSGREVGGVAQMRAKLKVMESLMKEKIRTMEKLGKARPGEAEEILRSVREEAAAARKASRAPKAGLQGALDRLRKEDKEAR